MSTKVKIIAKVDPNKKYPESPTFGDLPVGSWFTDLNGDVWQKTKMFIHTHYMGREEKLNAVYANGLTDFEATDESVFYVFFKDDYHVNPNPKTYILGDKEITITIEEV